MKIKLIYIGKNKSNNIEILVNNYEKKINHFLNFTISCLKNKNRSIKKEIIKESDTKLIIENLNKDEIIVVLDENGKGISTLEFSNFIQNQILNGGKKLTFVIGGAYGFTKEVNKHAKHKISLSKLTFSHDMARLFFVEQLYRSLTIINNIPYHNN
tara:strand:- start:170 stop:637 length:468 start_codon:yes stop_codon:yes gene_type:complete